MAVDVVTRVRQLVALAASDNPNEARNAAVKACAMIREHKIVLGVTATFDTTPPKQPTNWSNVPPVHPSWHSTGFADANALWERIMREAVRVDEQRQRERAAREAREAAQSAAQPAAQPDAFAPGSWRAVYVSRATCTICQGPLTAEWCAHALDDRQSLRNPRPLWACRECVRRCPPAMPWHIELPEPGTPPKP